MLASVPLRSSPREAPEPRGPSKSCGGVQRNLDDQGSPVDLQPPDPGPGRDRHGQSGHPKGYRDAAARPGGDRHPPRHLDRRRRAPGRREPPDVVAGLEDRGGREIGERSRQQGVARIDGRRGGAQCAGLAEHGSVEGDRMPPTVFWAANR